jgi:hypothetical protein
LNERVITGATAPLVGLLDAGYTLEQIDKEFKEMVAAELRSPAILAYFSLGEIVAEGVSLAKIYSSAQATSLYRTCLDIHRRYFDQNEEEYCRVLALWEDDIAHAISIYWSGVQLEMPKKDLSLEDCAYEIFRLIGAMLEGTFQVFLKEILHVLTIGSGRSVSFEDIKVKSLGQVVSELENIQELKGKLTLSPWGVPLNQWRNIAQHLSISVANNKVDVAYGKDKKIQLAREDLFKVAHGLSGLFGAIKTAKSIQMKEQIEALSKFYQGHTLRTNHALFEFTLHLTAIGFEVVSADIKTELAIVEVVDKTVSDAFTRGLFASQFTVFLWQTTKAESVTVHFHSNDRKFQMKSTALGSDCALASSGEISPGDFAKYVRFEVIDERDGSEKKITVPRKPA